MRPISQTEPLLKKLQVINDFETDYCILCKNHLNECYLINGFLI